MESNQVRDVGTVQPAQSVDKASGLEEVLRALLTLGLDEAYARAQLEAADSEDARLAEVASLAVESEACVLLTRDMSLPVGLFTLVDGLRQAGLAAFTARSVQGDPMLVFEAGRTAAYEIKFEAHATLKDVIRTVAYILPRTHQLLVASEHERDGQLPVIVLNRTSYVALTAVIPEPMLDRVFVRAGSDPGAAKLQLCDGPVPSPNLTERYHQHAPQKSAASNVEETIERVRAYDPRVPWPADRTTAPGQDFAALCDALSAEPLSQCLRSGSEAELAQLLMRFALVTVVGAHSDLLAVRRNPGTQSQAVVGRGQLVWAYFVFVALGADTEAERVAKLLDDPWVRGLERARTLARQRAYYDLARFLYDGSQGSCLLRLFELLPLRERSGWQTQHAVEAATAVHSEPLGDQLTHHPLYHVWPASLFALARKAGALDLLPLPIDNPFLLHPLSVSQVDLTDPLIERLQGQLQLFDALDVAHLPVVLDPLPVIVDVQITKVEGDDVHGHTLLAAHDDAEHQVMAPRGGRRMAPGEIWLLEVLSAQPATTELQVAELGPVRCAITVPTGQWLERVSRSGD